MCKETITLIVIIIIVLDITIFIIDPVWCEIRPFAQLGAKFRQQRTNTEERLAPKVVQLWSVCPQL